MTSSLAPAPDAFAPGQAPSLDQVRALVEERGRYEGWLAALEERRGSAPAHVLERVREDYTARLGRVFEQLAEHVEPLRQREAALAQRHADAEQALGGQRDLLAETELRTLVGEFTPEEGERRRTAAEQAIGALERDLGSAAAELADVRALAGRLTPPGGSAAQPTADQNAGSGGAGPEVAAAPAAQTHDAERASAPAAPTSATPPSGTPATGDAFGFDHGAVDAARVALGDQASPFAPALSEPGRGPRPGGSFGTPTFGVPSVGPAGSAPTAGQEKTLRCQDCGAMNYPTEWYCEKCGGELAAL